MDMIYPSIRLTHRYVGSWKHLDRWADQLPGVKMTPARETQPPGGPEGDRFEDGGTYVRYATLPAGLTRKQRADYRQALADSMTSEGCSHEYDCCGCASHYTRAFPTRDPRRVLLRTHVSYNY